MSSKDKLLNAALTLIRTNGYNATTVDELCAAAEVTKGSFFHHFKSKEELALEAVKHWTKITTDFFSNASFHKLKDPLDRFIGYIQFRKEILEVSIPEFTCLVGTMVQEIYHSNPEIRKACKESIFEHAKSLEKDITAAIKEHKPKNKINSKSLALHTQAVIQGAFILAKASGDANYASSSIDHLKDYIKFLFKN